VFKFAAKNEMKRMLLTLALLPLIFCAQTRLKNVDAEMFKKLIADKKYTLIDLRTTEELKGGKIPGAIQIDFRSDDFDKKLSALDPNKPYLIYCARGRRSAECGNIMEQKGFKEVVNLEKGYESWKQKGFETENPH
jgi:rhodanese-related sulfurtransferase